MAFTAMRVESSTDVEFDHRDRKPCRRCLKSNIPCVIVLLLLIGQFILIANTANQRTTIVQKMSVIPSIQQWRERIDCKTSCDWCKLDVIANMHPAKATVAFFSMRGTGGTYATEAVKQGTRTTVGVQNCFYPYPFNGMFSLDCSNAFYFKHYAMTRFVSSNSIVTETGYNPTKILLLVRNPLDAILAAYKFYTKCEFGIKQNYICYGSIVSELGLTDEQARNITFADFAEQYALLWNRQFEFTNTYPNESILIVYWEDLRMGTVKDMFTFLQTDLSPNASVSETCFHAAGINVHPPAVNNYDLAYPPPVRRKICPYLKAYWSNEKFGKLFC
jgi:hypothetical protein